MIVHVAARAGRGRRRAASWSPPTRRDRRRRPQRRRRGGDDPSRTIPRAPTASSRRSAALDPTAPVDTVVNVQGDLPTIEPADHRAPRCAARRRRPSTSPRSPPRSPATRRRTNPNVVKVVGRRGRAGAAAGALFHPRHRALGRRAALPPHRPLRLSPRGAGPLRRRCRRRRWSSARGSSSCARSKPACASTSRSSTPCRSASTRRPISSAPAQMLDQSRDLRRCRADQQHRLPGRAGRQLRHRPAATCIPAMRAAALPDLRGRLRRGQDRQGRPGDDPDRKLHRRPRRRHPPPAAALAACTSSASISCRSTSS